MKKILTFILVGMLALVVPGCGSTDLAVDTVKTSEENSQQIIYENEYVKVTYLGISNTIMSVSLENKSDEEITVLPMDSSVDGTMKQFTSGTLATIQPGKTFNQGWILGATPANEIEFELSICDENMSEILKTEFLKIEVK